MLELSLHVLDIVNNSVKAGASLIEITVSEDICHNLLTISIQDNGCGMDEEFLRHGAGPVSNNPDDTQGWNGVVAVPGSGACVRRRFAYHLPKGRRHDSRNDL